MIKLQFGYAALLLLQIVAASAILNNVDNASRTSPTAALRVPAGASMLASATRSPSAEQELGESFELQIQPHEILRKRKAEPIVTTPEVSTTSTLKIVNTFTQMNMSGSATSTTSFASSAAASTAMVMAVGSFTAADGGIYSFTSQSGYVICDGKTLAAGQVALIGNENVSEGPSGLVANGAVIAASTTTIMPSTSTTAPTTSMGSATSAASGSSTTIAVKGTSSMVVSAPSSTSSTASAAAAPTKAVGGAVALVGGIIGLCVL